MTKQDQHKDESKKLNDFSVCYNNHSILYILEIGKWRSRTKRKKILEVGINKL